MANASVNARRACLCMVIVALGLRLAVMAFLVSGQLNPANDHWQFGYEVGRIARAIVEGHGFSSPLVANTGPTAWQAPVCPYLVAGVFKLLGTYSKMSAWVLLSLNALISALTCLPIFLFARRSFGDRVALWSGWVWAFLPYAVYFPESRIWGTWLVTLLLCILFLMALHFENKSSGIWAWIGYGALWGVAALTDPIVLSVLLPLGIWLCNRLHRRKRAWLTSNFAAALAFAAVVSPWFVRNYRVFHHFIPFRDNLGLELHVGNNGDTFWWFPPLAGPWHNPEEWHKYLEQGELTYMQEKQRDALAFIRSHPGTFFELCGRRALYLWTSYWSLNRRYLADFPFDAPNIFMATILSAFALVGLWLAFRRAGAAVATPYFLVLLFFPLIYYVTHPEDWYRRPIDPFFVVLAAYAIASWCRPHAETVAQPFLRQDNAV